MNRIILTKTVKNKTDFIIQRGIWGILLFEGIFYTDSLFYFEKKSLTTPINLWWFFRFYLKYDDKGFTIILGENWTIYSPKIN